MGSEDLLNLHLEVIVLKSFEESTKVTRRFTSWLLDFFLGRWFPVSFVCLKDFQVARRFRVGVTLQVFLVSGYSTSEDSRETHPNS